MPSQCTVELVKYLNINNYEPAIGDLIIKHGWFTRVKWFGVVNNINDDEISILREGSMRLLATTSGRVMNGLVEKIKFSDILNALPGTYAIMQNSLKHRSVVWYV